MVSAGGHLRPKRRTEPAGSHAQPKAARTPTRKKSSAVKETPIAAAAADPSAQCVVTTPTERQHMIERAAYFRSQQRGFVPGFEMEDWLAAEAEVDQGLAGDSP